MSDTSSRVPHRRLSAANVALVGGLVDPPPRLWTPCGDGEWETTSPDGGVYKGIAAIFFGTGGDDQVFVARLWGWRRSVAENGLDLLLLPTHAIDVTVTLGTSDGKVGGIGADNLFADTLAVSGTPTLESTAYAIQSPQANRIALLKFDLAGAERVTMQYGTPASGTPATNANALLGGF